MHVINDDNFQDVMREAAAAGHGTGYVPSDTKLATKFTDSYTVIPRDQWTSLITQGQGTFLSDLIKAAKIPAKDQDGLGYCATADTEVLTEKGFVPWPDYNGTDLLATVNVPTGMLEFQAPLRVHAYEYSGEMIYSTNRRLDFGVTPDHRMLVRKWDEASRRLASEYTFQRAGELGWYCGMMHAPRGFIGTELRSVGIDDDRTYDGDDFLAMLSLVCSDGYAGGTENTRNWVSFACFDDARHAQLSALALRLGFHEQPGRRGVWIRYNAGALANWIRANCYVHTDLGAAHKRVPALVKLCNQRQIQHFLDCYGDRTHDMSQPDPQFFSTSKQIIDDLQELHLRIGKRSSIHKAEPKSSTLRATGQVIRGKHALYTLCVSKTERLCLEKKKHIEQDRYNGVVYCATVPNSTLVTRRNGSVLISGNCWVYASTETVEVCRAIQGQPYVSLSPESVGGPLTGWRNEGGNGLDALQQLTTTGACANSFMDAANSLHSSRWKTGWQADCANHKITASWTSVSSFDEVITALLLRIPVSIGLDWWGHQVLLTDPALVGNGYGVVFRNSWGEDWPSAGASGWSTLTESKSQPDGSFAAINVTALDASWHQGKRVDSLSVLDFHQRCIQKAIDLLKV
jgi:hypothetical protein